MLVLARYPADLNADFVAHFPNRMSIFITHFCPLSLVKVLMIKHIKKGVKIIGATSHL